MFRFDKKMPYKTLFILLNIKNISKKNPDPKKMDRIRNTALKSTLYMDGGLYLL